MHCTHPLHACSTRMPCTHALPACAARMSYTHALPACTARTHHTRALHACTRMHCTRVCACVCRGADGKKVGARGAHAHLMTDVARARTSSACPPPPPGRKNLDVGVVRSGSHHSADSTHRLALHARPFCATPLRCSTPPKRQTSTASNPDAHALCYTPTGHALLSAARRFVRSTQNIRSDSRGQSPNALAAHFQSAALHAAC